MYSVGDISAENEQSMAAGTNPGKEAPAFFTGKKIKFLELCFRKCTNIKDILQVYINNERNFRSIPLPSTSERSCSTEQKVKDITREKFIINDEIFDRHLFNNNNIEQSEKNAEKIVQVNSEPVNVDGGLIQSEQTGIPTADNNTPGVTHLSVRQRIDLELAAQANQEQNATENFRQIVMHLNKCALEKFGKQQSYARKFVIL